MGRAYHHGSLDEAMLEQAIAAVRELGTDHVSLRSIAQALNVSPSSAYNHFNDKEALLGEVAQFGLSVLDERMANALARHAGGSDVDARERFAQLGLAYIGFAIDEPNLFRLTFGPIGAKRPQTDPSSGPYSKLNAALDDLDMRRLIRPGTRDGLDMMVWAATHGFACLLVEGAVPPEAISDFMDSLAQLMLMSDTGY